MNHQSYQRRHPSEGSLLSGKSSSLALHPTHSSRTRWKDDNSSFEELPFVHDSGNNSGKESGSHPALGQALDPSLRSLVSGKRSLQKYDRFSPHSVIPAKAGTQFLSYGLTIGTSEKTIPEGSILLDRRKGVPLRGILYNLVPRVKPEDKNWVPAFAGMTLCGRKLAFRTLVSLRWDDAVGGGITYIGEFYSKNLIIECKA